MFKILTLNNISVRGLERLPRDRYEVASEIAHPDAILVRSADMHALEIPASVLAVARAGAGTNNIPVAKLSQRGIPVFNAPGANANAVKELVLAGLFLAARNICQAWEFVRALEGDDDALERGGREGQEEVRRLRTAGPHARRRRPGRHRRRGRQRRARPGHEGAGLRPADHRAARLAAVVRASSRR